MEDMRQEATNRWCPWCAAVFLFFVVLLLSMLLFNLYEHTCSKCESSGIDGGNAWWSNQSKVPLVCSCLLFLCRVVVVYVVVGAPKQNTSHGNEVLPHNTMNLIQWPCYQRGSPCPDPTGNRTTLRPPDHHKETQTAVVWTCLPFIRSGQNHFARHSERGKKTRQTEKEVGRQHQEMDRPGVRQVPEGSGEQRNMEETGCEIICGAPMTLALKE